MRSSKEIFCGMNVGHYRVTLTAVADVVNPFRAADDRGFTPWIVTSDSYYHLSQHSSAKPGILHPRRCYAGTTG